MILSLLSKVIPQSEVQVLLFVALGCGAALNVMLNRSRLHGRPGFDAPQLAVPNWWVAVGAAAPSAEEFVWRDDGIAVANAPLALSPSQRFVVMGDLHGVGQGAAATLAQVAVAWDQHQTACLPALKGMFALAVWDRQRQELVAARDAVGAYSLYYTATGSSCYLAPRLATLNRFHPRQLDQVALRDYLCCAFVPGHQTLWRQVRKLRPGTYLQLPSATTHRYWRLQEAMEGADRPLEWHGQRLRSHLETAVAESLPSQQPVGVYLSGGLDSSAITALAARLHPQPLHTYSIHFGGELPNELAFSSQVADHCRSQHHILEIPPATLWRRLPETMARLDEPIGDPLTVPNWIMAEAARQSVQVVLNGEGGDPCFGGPKNQPMLLNQLYGAAGALEALEAVYLQSFQKCAADLPQLLQPLGDAVLKAPSVFRADLQDTDTSYLNRLMGLNIKFKGADHILTKVNNLTRAAGLAGCSPLFDPRIVAFSMTVPPTYKLAGATEKAVLKAAVADLLPQSVLHRPKSGMQVPVNYGFRHGWRSPAKALLLNRRAAIAPYLNQALIRRWLNFEGDVWGRYGVKLWLLSSLELWLQANR